MHHEIAVPIEVRERARKEPLEQRIPVGSREHLIQGIGAASAAAAEGDGEQMQVVVSQHDECVICQRTHEPERLERIRAAVDQIADEPQAIAVRRELQLRDQRAQLLVTTLHITDGKARHCRIPGIASRNGAIGASKRRPSSPII